MNCKDAVEQIIAAPGQGALPPEIEGHLRGCAACAETRREQQALWRNMEAWEPPQISAGFDRRLAARLRGSGSGREAAAVEPGLGWWRGIFGPLRPAFPLALAGVLLVAAVVVENGRRTPVPPGAELAIQAGEGAEAGQINLALDDIQMLSEFEILPLGQTEEGRC